MARTIFRFAAVVISLFYTGIADVDMLNNAVPDLVNLLPVEDFAIVAVHKYLQEQEKVLDALQKYIEDYSKGHKGAIRKVIQTLSATTQENTINNNEEVKESDDQSDDESDEIDPYDYDETNYDRLCNGEILITADIQKKLKCRYADHGIPFLKIAPFKEEEAFLEPKIVLYHDVIYKEEVESLKRYSKPRLETAKSANSTTGEYEISPFRIAESTWYEEEEESKYVKLLKRRVDHMTGLSTQTAEALQIVYYGIGGLFKPHCDAYEDATPRFDSNIGNRIATVLFYVNAVTQGGFTVFPKLNVTIWPRKGSAVFWYNLKRNGELDYLSLHGACPVVSGEKWMVNFWLHERGQEFSRPCSLRETE